MSIPFPIVYLTMWLCWIFSNDSHSVKIQNLLYSIQDFLKCDASLTFNPPALHFYSAAKHCQSLPCLYFFIFDCQLFILRFNSYHHHFPPEFSFFSCDPIDFHIHLDAFFIFFVPNIVHLLPTAPLYSMICKLWWARTMFS